MCVIQRDDRHAISICYWPTTDAATRIQNLGHAVDAVTDTKLAIHWFNMDVGWRMPALRAGIYDSDDLPVSVRPENSSGQ